MERGRKGWREVGGVKGEQGRSEGRRREEQREKEGEVKRE